MKELRVLFVVPGPREGPSMVFSKREAVAVSSLGTKVECLFLGSRTSPVTLFSEWRRARAAIRAFKPEAIHAHFGTVTGLFSSTLSRRPLVITFRGSDLNPDPTVSWIRDRLGKLFSQLSVLRASRVICVSEQLRSRLWWQAWKAVVLTNGVDLSLFSPSDQSAAREALGLGVEDRIVLFNAGSSPAIKRLDLAREVAARLVRQDSSVRLLVLDGSQCHEQVPAYMNASDCLLITSDFEGSPTIVKEALACNLPIVSVDVGDVRERVRGVHPTRIVPRDIDSLARAVAEILSDRRRSNGRDAIAPLSEPEIARKLNDLYRNILGQATPPDSDTPDVFGATAESRS